MTYLFVTLFFTACVFVYAQDRSPVAPGWRPLAKRVALCAIVGWLLAVVHIEVLFRLSSIDPNAGQHM